MRTTLDIDDVVLAAARAKAQAESVSVGRALSDIALSALKAGAQENLGEGPSGFPLLPSYPGHVITDDLVARHRDDD